MFSSSYLERYRIWLYVLSLFLDKFTELFFRYDYNILSVCQKRLYCCESGLVYFSPFYFKLY